MKGFDVEAVTRSCVEWIQRFFKENGENCNAVVGISGGKDSSVVAALCVEALGKERVIGVLMPCGMQFDINYSHELVKYLGIQSAVVNIQKTVTSIKDEVSGALGGEWSIKSATNLPARIRMAVLYAVAQSRNGRVANTCNLSEDWVGYATRYGDAAGDFSPLANLTSDEVIAVGECLGLPTELTRKTPIDGLCGLTDEDNLGFTYATLNKYIRTGVCEDEPTRRMIDCMHKRNLFKLKMMPSFPYAASRLLGE